MVHKLSPSLPSVPGGSGSPGRETHYEVEQIQGDPRQIDCNPDSHYFFPSEMMK